MGDINKYHIKTQSCLHSFCDRATDLQIYLGLLDKPNATKVIQMQIFLSYSEIIPGADK